MGLEDTVPDGAKGEVIRLEVASYQAGTRLDLLLAGFEKASRSQVAELIRDGWATLNGVVFDKPARQAAVGDVIELVIPPPRIQSVGPEPIPLEILYRDGDLGFDGCGKPNIQMEEVSGSFWRDAR